MATGFVTARWFVSNESRLWPKYTEGESKLAYHCVAYKPSKKGYLFDAPLRTIYKPKPAISATTCQKKWNNKTGAIHALRHSFETHLELRYLVQPINYQWLQKNNESLKSIKFFLYI
jgi:hypothetical protein